MAMEVFGRRVVLARSWDKTLQLLPCRVFLLLRLQPRGPLVGMTTSQQLTKIFLERAI